MKTQIERQALRLAQAAESAAWAAAESAAEAAAWSANRSYANDQLERMAWMLYGPESAQFQ